MTSHSANYKVVALPTQASVTPEAPCPAASLAPPSIPEEIDRSVHATIARFTGGLSLAALALAFADWAVHFAAPPRASGSRSPARSWYDIPLIDRHVRALVRPSFSPGP